MNKEVVLLQAKPHWIYLVRPAVMGLMGLLLSILSLPALGYDYDPASLTAPFLGCVGSMALCAGGLMTVGGVVGIVLVALAYSSWNLTITTQRVIAQTGILSRTSREIMLRQVESVSVRQGLLGRLVGYGNVVVVGAGGTPIKVIAVSGPRLVQEKIQAALRALATGA